MLELPFSYKQLSVLTKSAEDPSREVCREVGCGPVPHTPEQCFRPHGTGMHVYWGGTTASGGTFRLQNPWAWTLSHNYQRTAR